MNMKEKLMRFMYGRYGVDTFNKFLVGSALVSFLLSTFFDSSFFYTLAVLLLTYSYFRMLSKNIYKRASENQNFLNRTSKIRTNFQRFRGTLIQLKTYHIYKCPSCRQRIRIPRGKGKIEITCPKCRSKFIKRS